MKMQLKDQAKDKKLNTVCDVTEYNLDDEKKLNVACVEIKGRYPDAGQVMNKKCKLLAFIREGSGSLTVNNNETVLSVGAAVLIEPGEHYFWKGNLKMFVACSPAWSAEEHIKIEG